MAIAKSPKSTFAKPSAIIHVQYLSQRGDHFESPNDSTLIQRLSVKLNLECTEKQEICLLFPTFFFSFPPISLQVATLK
jgi:hypothetical protein